METAAISYRVADFLKQHPPFHVMAEEDLRTLAGGGRVRFFEPNEYILWQGAPRHNVLVIQHGMVSLWDEKGSGAKLCDVRGAGDMLGIDQFDESPKYLYSARSTSDVLVYAFPVEAFAALVASYPYAQQYVSAYGSIASEYRSSQERRDPEQVFLHSLIARRALASCDGRTSIREAAGQMLRTGADAMAVLGPDQRAQAILTARSFLAWIEKGGRDAGEPVDALFDGAPLAIAADASVATGVMAMATAGADAMALTSDGTANGRVHGVVTSQDVGQVFGDQPVQILREIRHAADTDALKDLNQRARAFVLRHLTSPGSSDWLTGFTSLVDASILRRLIAMVSPEELPACWCFCGASGRGESLTRLAPGLVMIVEDGPAARDSMNVYRRVSDLLAECDYLPHVDKHYDTSFYAASLADWRQRYVDWVSDPVFKAAFLARPLFDLRPVHGRESLWHEIEGVVRDAVNRDLLLVLANDCLDSLPPLTFFHDAVVDDHGEETATFRLEHSALEPLVDVGRVFGMAAGKVLGSSTLERFAMARALLPADASIFREASDMLRTVLWQQGRVGISQGTTGAELPPALLGRYDRQVLRNGFRSILRLLEFTADLKWLKTL